MQLIPLWQACSAEPARPSRTPLGDVPSWLSCKAAEDRADLHGAALAVLVEDISPHQGLPRLRLLECRLHFMLLYGRVDGVAELGH